MSNCWCSRGVLWSFGAWIQQEAEVSMGKLGQLGCSQLGDSQPQWTCQSLFRREVSFFKGELGGVSEMFFTSSDQETCQTVHPEATGDLKDWRWICQAAATAIWALCLLSAAGIESTVHARWWLGQMAGVKKTWWCFSSCSRNLVILQKNPSMPLMICT